MSAAKYRLHGLKLSYFTGKLEAYFGAKGVPFDFIEMDTADFRRCAEATGVAQMPQVEYPDGSWRTDTTPIIAEFEDAFEGPSLHSTDPAARFLSLLLEDFFDEWLWRPALYYRWAFAEDMHLMSAQIARTMLRDMRLPFAVKRRFILARQRRVYLRQDGVTPATKAQIEALYFDTINAVEQIFATRPYLFGERPCEADFGLFGPFFRHFSYDPTPSAILRERGPNTLAWVARLWAARPADIRSAEPLGSAPEDLAPLIDMAGRGYLPYLQANAAAAQRGDRQVSYDVGGVTWRVPVSPYRAACLDALKHGYQALAEVDRGNVSTRLGAAASILADPNGGRELTAAPKVEGTRPLDRLWRRAAT